MPELVQLREYGPRTAELVLSDHPRRNALSTAMLTAIAEAVSVAVANGASALVVRGERDFFSAGADIDELTGGPADAEHDALVSSTAELLRGSPLITVAAVQKGAVGAACELACACDVRVGDDETYFAFPAITMGLVYRPSVLRRMVALFGHSTASRLLLCGERIGGQDAHSAGLTTVLASRGRVRAEALDLAASLSKEGVENVSVPTARILAEAVEDQVDDTWWDIHNVSFGSEGRHAAVYARKAQMKERNR